MPDPSSLTYVLDALGGAAALGLAASGLVDTTKLFWGGVSNVGFTHIQRALSPYAEALRAAIGEEWAETLRSHWINGVPKDDQKAKAKAPIRLGLSVENAPKLAAAARVDTAGFTQVVQRIQSGVALQQTDVEQFGRFDAAIEAAIDAALERADQQYRNASKALAALVAVILAVIAGATMFYDEKQSGMYLFVSTKFWLAVVIGTVSVPLAPIAKDLATSLQTASKALKAAGG